MASVAVIAAVAVQAPGAQAATAFSAHLTRAPYLTDLVALHVNVNWATDQSATTGSLQWGPVTGGTCTLSTTMTAARNAASITVGTVEEYQWKAALTLPAQGTYCYRPFLASTDLLGANPSPQFTTQAAAGDTAPFSFDVFGDWGSVDGNGKNADQANLMAQIAASGARFAVTVGDNGYPTAARSTTATCSRPVPTPARSSVRASGPWPAARSRSSPRSATTVSAGPPTPTSRRGRRTTPCPAPAAATRTTSTAA